MDLEPGLSQIQTVQGLIFPTGALCVCVCLFVLFTLYVLAKVWRPKLCDGNLVRRLVDTTGNLAIKPHTA